MELLLARVRPPDLDGGSFQHPVLEEYLREVGDALREPSDRLQELAECTSSFCAQSPEHLARMIEGSRCGCNTPLRSGGQRYFPRCHGDHEGASAIMREHRLRAVDVLVLPPPGPRHGEEFLIPPCCCACQWESLGLSSSMLRCMTHPS